MASKQLFVVVLAAAIFSFADAQRWSRSPSPTPSPICLRRYASCPKRPSAVPACCSDLFCASVPGQRLGVCLRKPPTCLETGSRCDGSINCCERADVCRPISGLWGGWGMRRTRCLPRPSPSPSSSRRPRPSPSSSRKPLPSPSSSSAPTPSSSPVGSPSSSPLPSAGSTGCARLPGQSSAASGLEFIPVATGPNGVNFEFTVTRDRCGNSDLNADSLQLADAQAIANTVCANIRSTRSLKSCGISALRTGSIIINFSLEIEGPVTPELLALIQQIAQRTLLANIFTDTASTSVSFTLPSVLPSPAASVTASPVPVPSPSSTPSFSPSA